MGLRRGAEPDLPPFRTRDPRRELPGLKGRGGSRSQAVRHNRRRAHLDVFERLLRACSALRACLDCRQAGMAAMITCRTMQGIRPTAHAVREGRIGRQPPRIVRAVKCVQPLRTKVEDVDRKTTVCRAASSDAPIPAAPVEKTGFKRFVDVLTTMFPVWVFLGASIGIAKPSMVTWLSSDLFTLGLGFLMLSMGLTLTFDDFKKCLKNPGTIGVGFLAQYIIKPVLGATIARVLHLSPPLATGLVLVSCCPGGQASNVATYIAHGNVALSVLMTTASTIAAIFMTPLLTKLLAGQLVPVDAVGLAVSTFQVVLVPTLIGVLSNEFFPKVVKKITPVLPLVGVIITTMLCASPVGQVSEVLKAQGTQLLLPVGILHIAAFSLGYFISKFVGFSETTARTVSIETGMQSAALGFLLAQQHFADPMVAVPSAVSVVFMALGGAALAVYWRGKPVVGEKDDFIA